MPDHLLQTVTLWRAFVPRWAFVPLSGEGAARFGGRWNPVGIPTIYAARELSTAWAEYNQGLVQHPALIAQLELQDAAFADLMGTSVLANLDVPAEIHHCEWRQALDSGKVPETHRLQARLKEDGFDGVIYPSFMSPGGRCVALWNWNGKGAARLDVVDPDGRIPKTQASWL